MNKSVVVIYSGVTLLRSIFSYLQYVLAQEAAQCIMTNENSTSHFT